MSEKDRSNVILLPLFQHALPQPLQLAPEAEEEPEEPKQPPPHLLEAAIEALLIAAERPITTDEINEWLDKPGRRKIYNCLRNLQICCEEDGRGFQLIQVMHGWQYRTNRQFAKWVQVMKGSKKQKLSKAALEALSIIAYQQPITRIDVDSLRGVDSGAVLKVLLDNDLIEVVGRKKEVGTPLLYGTTKQFLSMFNLHDLADLPTLRDLRELEGTSSDQGTPPTPS